MNELLYFSASDLMVQVRYKQENNSLNYFTHRKLTFGERVIVEQYLLTNIAVKTDYYKKHPANFNYAGVNSTLVKDLNQFHLKNTMKVLNKKDKELEDEVKNLIEKSMEKYYFEKIGTKLLEIKELLKGQVSEEDMEKHHWQLKDLIDAYNLYTEKRIAYEDVVPSELLA